MLAYYYGIVVYNVTHCYNTYILCTWLYAQSLMASAQTLASLQSRHLAQFLNLFAALLDLPIYWPFSDPFASELLPSCCNGEPFPEFDISRTYALVAYYKGTLFLAPLFDIASCS